MLLLDMDVDKAAVLAPDINRGKVLPAIAVEVGCDDCQLGSTIGVLRSKFWLVMARLGLPKPMPLHSGLTPDPEGPESPASIASTSSLDIRLLPTLLLLRPSQDALAQHELLHLSESLSRDPAEAPFLASKAIVDPLTNGPAKAETLAPWEGAVPHVYERLGAGAFAELKGWMRVSADCKGQQGQA